MNETHNPISVTTEEFREKVMETSQRIPVLVDFWADWCEPCRALAPVLERIATIYGEKLLIAKVNADTENELTAQIGVRSLPTLILFKKGAPVSHLVGAQPESAVRALIDSHIEKESDDLRSQARAALERGDTDGALAALRRAIDEEPENVAILLEIADVQLRSGHMEDAEQVLADLPAHLREDPEAKRLQARLAFTRARSGAEEAAGLQKRIEADSGDLEARYQLGAASILTGDYESGLDQFLEIIRRDRKFRSDVGREAMLAAFELMGSGNPLVSRYRRKMAALMY